MQRKLKAKPPRLGIIFQKYDPPLFFVTFNTHTRRPLLASRNVHAAFILYCQRGIERNVGVGRYVIMPDHVHLFVRLGLGSEITLGSWIKGLKHHLGSSLMAAGYEPAVLPGQKLRAFWQPGFNDHLLRNDESYAQKWDYVRQNPVRTGLVSRPEDWPYAGEIVMIDRT